MTNEINYKEIGFFFDIDETTKAYELGGVEKHWTDTDYAISDNEWNEEAYYNDFDEWWSNLDAEEQKRIADEIIK